MEIKEGRTTLGARPGQKVGERKKVGRWEGQRSKVKGKRKVLRDFGIRKAEKKKVSGWEGVSNSEVGNRKSEIKEGRTARTEGGGKERSWEGEKVGR